MNIRIIYFAIFLILISLINACEIYNPDEKVPAFIMIDSITVSTDYNTQGTTSSKISDAWIYVDEKLVGVYELPIKAPILESGNHNITIKAGIKSNGISSTRPFYAFYNSATYTNTRLTPDSIIHLNPVITYSNDANFLWKEDFEDGGVSLIQTGEDSTLLFKTSNPSEIFEGISAYATLDSQDSIFIFKSSEKFTLPINKIIYLEMNYKNNNVFFVGLIVHTSTQTQRIPVLVVNRSEHWNKIYVNFSSVVTSITGAINYEVFIAAEKEDDVANPLFFFDNFKLIKGN